MAPPRKKGSKGASATASRHVWNKGDLVLAKVKGHPWWPAQVSDPDDFGYAIDRRKVFVYFFGTKQIGFVQPVDVKSFTSETKKSLLAKTQVKNTITDFTRALKEICEASKGLGGRTDDDSQVSLNEGSDTSIEEAVEHEEEDQLEENISSALVSRGHKRNINVLRATPSETFERETRSRSHVGNGLETRQSAEKAKGLATYEPNKKRRKLLASNEEPDRRSSAAANAKKALPPRRLSSRHSRTSEASVTDGLVDTTDFSDQTAIDRLATIDSGISANHKKEGELADVLDQLAECFADGNLNTLHPVKDIGSPNEHLPECTYNSDGISFMVNTVEASHDLLKTSPIHSSVGTEEVSGSNGASQHALKEKAEDIVPQTLLPKKKRRASRRLERDPENTNVETDEQLHSASLHAQQSEGLAKSGPSEYQRRKRTTSLVHSQVQGSQPAGNDSNQEYAVVKEEVRATVITSDTCGSLEVLPSASLAPDQSESLETTSIRESPELEKRNHVLARLSKVSGERDALGREGKVWAISSLENHMNASNPRGEPVLDSQDVESHASLVKQATDSRFTAERDTSLPPKADKYRIRSSIADGEAALPPSKRRQRALEAMSACAAEAAAVESSTKVEEFDLPAAVQSSHENETQSIKQEEPHLLQHPSPQIAVEKPQDCELRMQSVLAEHENLPASQPGDDEEKLAESTSLNEQHIAGSETTKPSSNGGPSLTKDLDTTVLTPRKGESGKSRQLKGASHGKIADGSKASSDGKSKLKAKIFDASQDKAAHDNAVKHPEHFPKQIVLSQSRGVGLSKVPSETKSGFKDLIRATSSNEKSRLEILGAFRTQEESNTNKVRAAVEAAQRAKEALMKRQVLYSKSEYSNDLGGTPSPNGSSLLNSPGHNSLAASSGMVSRDMSQHIAGCDLTTGSDLFGTSGQDAKTSPSRSLSSKDATLAGDTEASVARDTFEGMLETLSRTKESIARATRHALECAKFGIVDQD
ncbi:hypothetical protein L7F22_065729 [Adiantum nelumboides]|nr:hypothetical protein [Adiantum nelumboides]